jgi:non-specific serine/threonine protein kinase
MTIASVRYRFACFELQPDERRLLARGEAVHLRPRALDLLITLVEQSGHLITKDEFVPAGLGHVGRRRRMPCKPIYQRFAKVLGADAIATGGRSRVTALTFKSRHCRSRPRLRQSRGTICLGA